MRPAVRRSQRIQRVLKRRNRTTGRMVRRHRARQSPKLPPVFPRHHLTDIQLRILLYEPSLTCKPPRNRKAGIELLPEDRLDCLIPRPLRATKRRRPKASRVLKKTGRQSRLSARQRPKRSRRDTGKHRATSDYGEHGLIGLDVIVWLALTVHHHYHAQNPPSFYGIGY